jgi:outer membrane receptor protein involved in Fe transport
MALTGAVAQAQTSADSPRSFQIPAQPLPQALEQFAEQASVSVGLAPGAGCAGVSRAVTGSLSAAAALARLLPEGCRIRQLDRRSFVVLGPAPPRAPATMERPAPPAATPLDELIVTAERRPEMLGRATYAVSALDREALARLGGGGFQDVALQLVGMTVTNLGSGRNKIFIRGLSDGSFTGRTQSTVGLYLDDAPITYDAPDPDLRLVDVDRVEVLRGPQGTLYGSGSIGGIVRFVTARPDPAAFAAEVTTHGAVTQDGAPSSGLDGWINLPLLNGAAAVRGVAYTEDRGGYLDNPRLGLKDVNDSRRVGGRLAGLIKLPDNWDISATLSHQSINAADAQYTTSGGLTRDTGVQEPHDNDFNHAALTLSHEGRAADVKITTAYIDHRLDTRYDAADAFAALPIGATAKAVDEGQRVKLWLGEGTISGGGGRTRGLVGLFVSGGEEEDAAQLSTGAVPLGALYRRRDVNSEGALYGEATYSLTRRISVTAGGRLFARRLETTAETPLAGAAAPPFSARRIDEGVAGKLRVAYAWTPSVTFYAQVQDGYRPGGFNNPGLAKLDATPPQIPVAFEPDRLRSYEVGGEAPLMGGALRLRWDLFHAQWRRLQSDQFVASGLPITVNIGDGANTGIEAEVLWTLTRQLQVRAEAMFDDPQLTRANNIIPALPDVGLPGVPYETAALDVRYGWQVAGLEASVSAQTAYVGRSSLSFAGEAASGMGGYATARLQGDVAARAWRISAWIDNLANARADTFAFGNPFSRPLGLQSTPLRPRTLTASVSRRF